MLDFRNVLNNNKYNYSDSLIICVLFCIKNPNDNNNSESDISIAYSSHKELIFWRGLYQCNIINITIS